MDNEEQDGTVKGPHISRYKKGKKYLPLHEKLGDAEVQTKDGKSIGVDILAPLGGGLLIMVDTKGPEPIGYFYSPSSCAKDAVAMFMSGKRGEE